MNREEMYRSLYKLADKWSKLARTFREYGVSAQAETMFACVDDLVLWIEKDRRDED